MTWPQLDSLSRRHFCLCCLAGATCAATNGWLTPREAFAEARGIVSLIKDSAAVSPIVTHKLLAPGRPAHGEQIPVAGRGPCLRASEARAAASRPDHRLTSRRTAA
jgi:hypothetical protein